MNLRAPRPIWNEAEHERLVDEFFQFFPPDRYADEANRPRARVIGLIFEELKRIELPDALSVVAELALSSAKIPMPHDVHAAVTKFRTGAHAKAQLARDLDAEVRGRIERARAWVETLSDDELRAQCERVLRAESVADRDRLSALDPRTASPWLARLGWLAPRDLPASAAAQPREAAFRIAS